MDSETGTGIKLVKPIKLELPELVPETVNGEYGSFCQGFNESLLKLRTLEDLIGYCELVQAHAGVQLTVLKLARSRVT